MKLNVPFILKSLSYEELWKAEDYVCFSFENWNLTLKREDDEYKPFEFLLYGQKEGTNETWCRRYESMEKAYLHIFNCFNENAVIPDRYKSLADIINCFPVRDMDNAAFINDYSMDLEQFLSYFDFNYDIVSPGGEYENRIRQELIDDEELTMEDASKDLLCLIDCQGAYFGDIGKERFPISSESVEKIIDRMDVYIREFIDEFQDALEVRGIDAEALSLEEMILECKALGVGDEEVCYSLAEAVNSPKSIYIQEVLEQEKSNDKSKEPLVNQIQTASNGGTKSTFVAREMETELEH